MRHVRYSKEYPVRFVSLEVILPDAKLLVLVAALTEETRGLMNKAPRQIAGTCARR